MSSIPSSTVTPCFTLVDVFGRRPYGGNPLPVVFDQGDLSNDQMLQVTQEFRQFETVFISRTPVAGRWRARIFDLFAELPFAGHPLLGAAVAICEREGLSADARLELDLGERLVTVHVERSSDTFVAWLDAGVPSCKALPPDSLGQLLSGLGLMEADLVPNPQGVVMGTGLSYAIVPVTSDGIAKAHIDKDIGSLLQGLGAQFAVLVDPALREIRHWNNDGRMEDIATGSAAGVVGAYLVAQGHARRGETIELSQGRFAGRPSELRVRVEGEGNATSRVHVGGQVHVIASGQLKVLP